ncbi:MAG: hypothetical protein WD059_06310 [Balneolaceae bacterium]
MRKLTPSEKRILNRLIFPESFEVIQEETNLQFGEIRDDLINLMNHHLIEVVDPENPDSHTTIFSDADNLKESMFRITKSGIKHISKTK